jgi:hypothetical protein
MSPTPSCATRHPACDAYRFVDIEVTEIITLRGHIVTPDSYSEEGLIVCINVRGESMIATVLHHIFADQLARQSHARSVLVCADQ